MLLIATLKRAQPVTFSLLLPLSGLLPRSLLGGLCTTRHRLLFRLVAGNTYQSYTK